MCSPFVHGVKTPEINDRPVLPGLIIGELAENFRNKSNSRTKINKIANSVHGKIH
jgi:hypothetical protein